MLHPFMGIKDWDRIGLSVAESAARLQRIAYVDRQLMRIESGHMIVQSQYEIKGALGRMVWQDACHYDQFRNRCKQLRMSTVAFEKCPNAGLEKLMEKALESPTLLCLFTALFEVIKPMQIEVIQKYLKEAQPIVDDPTIQMMRHQLIDREDQIMWGQEALRLFSRTASEEECAQVSRWREYMIALLQSCSWIACESKAMDPKLEISTTPFQLPLESTRDSRFTKAVTKFKDIQWEDNDAGRFKMMMYTRFFEMTPAEAVACVHFASEGKPWAFYYDTARHLWDEVRHAWFGEAALKKQGYDIYEAPNWTGWYDMTRNLFSLEEAYIHLTIAIEKAAMKYPPGKREEWEFCRDIAKDPLMTTFQDFDWADEVVHAGFGQKWIIDHLFAGDSKQAQLAADRTLEKRSQFMAAHKAGEADKPNPFAGGY